MRWLPLALLTACTYPTAAEYLVVQRGDDGTYAIDGKAIPELTDPHRARGTVATGYRGGFLGLDGYDPGSKLAIDYVIEDGLAVPTDEDGLVIWSFYAHLAGTHTDLADRGFDVDPVFPVDFAYQPVSVMDFASVENAAYANNDHVFILFPDLIRKDVPLATNEGVVRHEFGHAWFKWITKGDVHAPIDVDQDAVPAGLEGALNEGFADMVATLSLDDPRFIEASLPLTERDVSGDHVFSQALVPTGEEDLLTPYDPYALGTVFASLVWDIRLASDPQTALELVVGALQVWAETDSPDVYTFPNALVELAQDTAAAQAACEAYATRMATDPPEACP